MQKTISLFIISLVLLACTGRHKSTCLLTEIGRMPSFEEGYEQGVSACYAALYNDTLYIAGGCNFPEKPAAEGGAKRYYKGIYKAAVGDTLIWEQVGTLPATSAYGASMQHGGKWYIAGGMNEQGSHCKVYCIDLERGCKIDTLPSLPCTIDNTAGIIDNNTIYIAGGNCNGKASNMLHMFSVTNNEATWQCIPMAESRPRVQPVCAAQNGKIYVWGGFTPSDSIGNAMVHTDGICYNPANGEWSNVEPSKANGATITLSGGTATTLNGNIFVAGGVNKEIFTDAISGEYKLISKEEYMHQPAEWYSFNGNLMLFDGTAWHTEYADKAFARAGAFIIGDSSNIYYIGGELKPGIRTPQIHRYRRL